MRARAAHRAALRQRLVPSMPRGRRRFGALSTLELVRLVLVFVGVQALAWLYLSDLRTRLVVAVLTLACLAVLVTTRRRSSR